MSENATENNGELVIPNPLNPFLHMEDRELLLYIAHSHAQILADIQEVKDKMMPMIDSLASSPMLRPFLGKVQS